MLRVTKIEVIEEDMAVDLEVGGNEGNGTNTYLLGNGMVSHNTVSILAGALPGIHYPIAKYYIRRLRIPNNHPLTVALVEAGYKTEPDVVNSTTTTVVEFPMKIDDGVRIESEVTIGEKFMDVITTQELWSDNQVSVTITFDPNTEGHHIKSLLEKNDHKLKSISLLPLCEGGAYAQMPYEKITKEQYEEMMKGIDLSKLYNFKSFNLQSEEETDKFCDGDRCIIVPRTKKI